MCTKPFLLTIYWTLWIICRILVVRSFSSTFPDPKHTAKSVKEWLATQNFQVLQWPAQSPDLNPIENLWAYLKFHLTSDFNSPPSSLKVLWERVEEIWNKIPLDYCESLVRSMPKRLLAVKKAKGLWTKY